MKTLWRRYSARVDAMTLRERVMSFSAVALLVGAAAYTLLIEPQFSRGNRLSQEIAQRQGETKAAQDELTRIARSRQADPDRAERERVEELRAQLAALEERIAAEERRFTPAAQMRKVVDEMLARNNRVRLVDLKTLPVTTIAEARGEVKDAKSAERLIYRHGVELTVSGNYLDLLAYLAELERLPTQLYWSNVVLNADAYPKVSMTLVLFTLSLDRAWMSV